MWIFFVFSCDHKSLIKMPLFHIYMKTFNFFFRICSHIFSYFLKWSFIVRSLKDILLFMRLKFKLAWLKWAGCNINLLLKLLAGKIVFLLSCINFKIPYFSSRNNYPFYTPIFTTNYVSNEPTARMMQMVNLEPSTFYS